MDSNLSVAVFVRVFGTSMMAEYEEFADPSERPDDQDDDLGETLTLSPPWFYRNSLM